MDFLKKWYLEIQPETVVEFQPDDGSISRFLRPLHRGYWYGVETWAPSVDRYSLWDAYDKIIVSDIRHLDLDSIYALPDLVILDDVIPHMAQDEAVVILNRVKVWTDAIVLSIPQEEPQHEAGNWTYGHQWNPGLEDIYKILGQGSIKTVATGGSWVFLWRAAE